MKPAAAAAPTDATADFAARQAKALLVHARLCAEYGAPFPFFSSKDPLSELVSALLSHRTKNAESHRAYQELKATYPTWEAVRDAPTKGVQHAIRACTWPEQKAPPYSSCVARNQHPLRHRCAVLPGFPGRNAHSRSPRLAGKH